MRHLSYRACPIHAQCALGALLVFCMAVPLLAATNSSFTWNYRKITLAPSAGVIRVVLPDLPNGVEYAIGIKSSGTTASQAHFVVGAVHFSNSPGSMRLISSIENWPSSQIVSSPGQIQVLGVLSQGPALLIYGSVPARTQLQIEGPDGPIASGMIAAAGSLAVYDGNVVGAKIKGAMSLVPYLLHMRANPTARSAQAGPVALPDGRYFVNPAALASHLVNLTRPSYPVGKKPPQFASAHLLITIGADGTVREVQQESGDRAAIQACETAIRSWKFTPFEVKGQPVAVQAPVVFFFFPSGNVTSPVFDELAR